MFVRCVPLVCRVSFSIPVLAWVCSSCVMGIVFDTCVCVELPFVGLLLPFECRVSFSIPVLAWVRSSCVSGIVFDTRENGGLLFVFFYSLLLLGIIFDTCVCGGCASPVCWVSFSIPMSTSVALVIKAIASQFILFCEAITIFRLQSIPR